MSCWECGLQLRQCHSAKYRPLSLPMAKARAMRLPRMTTRRWMVAVAYVAVLLSVFFTFQRHATYRRMFLAYDHDSRASIRGTIWLNEKRVEVFKGRAAPDPQAAAEAAAISEVLRTLRRSAVELERERDRYESAVRRPWSLLEPEPLPAGP